MTNGTNGGSKADAWGTSSLDKTNNNSNEISFGKVKKYSEKDVKKSNKFTADYSDNFEDDLAQVLKRSVVDQ